MKQRIYFPLLVFVGLLPSCFPYQQQPYYIPLNRQMENKYHVPGNANAPLISSKNDMRVGLTHSMGSKYRAIDIDAALVGTKHIGIAASISAPTRRGDIHFPKAEFSAGSILPMKNNWHFETYAGVNGSTMENFHVTGSSKGRWKQYFIQPAIAVRTEDQRFQVGLVSRFTKAHFNLLDTSFHTERESYAASQLQILINNPDHLFWEPGLTIRLGGKAFQFNVNYTNSVQLSESKFSRVKEVVSIGMLYKFNTSGKSRVVKN